ncbi:hypothetical protein GQS_05610 [Thermococcus sp. 4557]|uniref:DUF11 domain-containing protein n=1 Tax=Thermococcus sp. (strain CGMCC 1.5172 / 4557) TaxID=1042877 RepID=UPI000219EDFA|nr:DUF11 domain-containing protein [Thermococcus sp. 4557]AEK73022.1 hypothetical protein GQS_05610 [Thermococcus sp. 4557]
MRGIIAVLITIALASLVIVSSSGTFVSFGATREVKVQVVPHEQEYLGFDCEDGYAAVIEVNTNSELDFDALTVRNYLNDMKDVTITLHPDYSGLPAEVTMFIETEDGAARTLASEEEYTFFGNVTVGNAEPGEYIIPVDMYATWNGGDASISTCPIKLIIKGGPTIEKELLSGPLELPTHTYAEWTFRITVTNPGEEQTLTIKDVIPGEFEIESIDPSAGTYTVTQTGAAHHITWEVHLGAGESAHMNVTVYTKLNPAGKQEFTSCGDYILNEGAELVEYGITSESITVHATCEGGGDCDLCIMNRWISGVRHLPRNTPADYHTRIIVKNRGDERDLVVTQYVGSQFTLVNNIPTKGTVSTEVLPNGKTRVTWTLHLAHNEVARLNLYEHTDGIYTHSHRYVMLVSTPCVAGCECHGCAKYVYVYACGCHAGRDAPEAPDVYEDTEIESDCCTEACEG